MTGGETGRVVEAGRPAEEGETPGTGESGLTVRIQLCGVQQVA